MPEIVIGAFSKLLDQGSDMYLTNDSHNCGKLDKEKEIMCSFNSK